jgi:type III restriction enzyme
MKNTLVINDEAHHCYREKPKDADDEELKGDDRKEAEKIMKRPGFGFRAEKP